MALLGSGLWDFNGAGQAAAVGAGYFNPANAGMLTNLTATGGNTAAPVVSSVSYNFVAGDVNAWVYVQQGTNWFAGWYQIASLSGNAAVLNCAVGSALVVQAFDANTGAIASAANVASQPASQWSYRRNATIGCASVASPTGGTFTVDYSQKTTGPIAAIADFGSVPGTPLQLNSATAGFTPVMVGNCFHQTNTGTGAFGVIGYYEIATYVSATAVTLDRTPNSGTASVACTGYVGGAMRFGDATRDPALMLALVAGNKCFHNGSGGNNTLAAGVTTTAGTFAAPITHEGYAVVRGDAPLSTTRPLIDGNTTSVFTSASRNFFKYMIFSSSVSSTFTPAGGGIVKSFRCKFLNLSVTANRPAVNTGTATYSDRGSEFVSLRGNAIAQGVGVVDLDGSYLHSSDVGIKPSGGGASSLQVNNSVIANCVTAAVSLTAAITTILNFLNSLFYGGATNKLAAGIIMPTGTTIPRLISSNLYGFVTALTHADPNVACTDGANNWFNNTNDVSATNNWQKGEDDTANDPKFASATQIVSTGAATSGSTLTDATVNFTTLGFTTDDYVQITAGAGGVVSGMYAITAVGTTTLTLFPAPGTGTATTVNWQATILRGGFRVLANSPTEGAGFP